MGGRNLTIFVLDQMQMFDEKIAPPRPVSEQNFDFMRSSRVDLASLGRGFGALAAAAGMLERANLVHVMTHRNASSPSLSVDRQCKLWHARCQVAICATPRSS